MVMNMNYYVLGGVRLNRYLRKRRSVLVPDASTPVNVDPSPLGVGTVYR